jgi:hypothetical protein
VQERTQGVIGGRDLEGVTDKETCKKLVNCHIRLVTPVCNTGDWKTSQARRFIHFLKGIKTRQLALFVSQGLVDIPSAYLMMRPRGAGIPLRRALTKALQRF